MQLISTAKLAELANSAEKQGYKYAQVRTKNLLAIGADPMTPTHVIDLSREVIRPISAPDDSEFKAPHLENNQRSSRRTGSYSIEIKGNKIECASLKELLSEGLKAFESFRRGTLSELSKVMPRSKRIVAREPTQLFSNPELVQKYSEKLIDGWWFGTNNSKDETVTWLRRGAEKARLAWGKDVRINIH
jgi:hypothetical protein